MALGASDWGFEVPTSTHEARSPQSHGPNPFATLDY